MGFTDPRSYDSMKIELAKAGLAIIVAIVTLAFTWIIGQGLTNYWNVWQKRRELDISAANQFYSLYGEFLTVWRLWKVLRRDEGTEAKTPFEFPAGTRFELLKRASAAEGNVEAMILKLAAERHLGDNEIKKLGLFRQAYQQLREHIRDDKRMSWIRSDPEYQLTKELAAEVAHLLSRFPKQAPSCQETIDSLAGVTGCRSRHWGEAVQRVRSGNRSAAWGSTLDV